MSIPEDIIQLHEDLIELGSKIRSKSESKFKEEEHVERNVQVVF